jgi:hypothetical protein
MPGFAGKSFRLIPSNVQAGRFASRIIPLGFKLKVASGRTVIAIHKAVTRLFELHLDPAQLLVLHLQLDLMQLQLMHQPLHIVDRHGRDVAARGAQPRFRLPAELGEFR